MNKNLQDLILNQVRKEGVHVMVSMVNGDHISGLIKSFDNYVIVVEAEKKQQMIYKHAISSIIPAKHLHSLFTQQQSQKE